MEFELLQIWLGPWGIRSVCRKVFDWGVDAEVSRFTDIINLRLAFEVYVVNTHGVK